MLRAVTFDFWNTVMWEEPGSLGEGRLGVWREDLAGERIEPEAFEQAHDEAHRAYEQAWQDGRQFTVHDAAALVTRRLGLQWPDAERRLVEGYCEAGRRAAVHPS